MNDLLLLKPTKKSYIGKLEDLLKMLLKMDLRFHPKKCQLFRKNYHTWVESLHQTIMK